MCTDKSTNHWYPGFVIVFHVRSMFSIYTYIYIIIIKFPHGLGCLTCSGIDLLPPFLGASVIPSSSGFVGEGMFQEAGVVHSFEVVDPGLFVFESHILYSRDL